jgi:hypothetical protein
MSKTLDTPKREIMSASDLDRRDAVRTYFERRAEETREQAVRPTEIGLTDPSQSLKGYCTKCGASHEEPFGNYQISSRLHAHGVSVQVYPCGGVIIHTDHDVTVSTRRRTGLGTSGQLGFTRTVMTPDR